MPDDAVPGGLTLDPFQVAALEAIDAGQSVLVAAPTGSGKTLVAEHAVAHALGRGGKAFYTTPIKALSNQKYHGLVRRHGAASVGLLTGDNAVNGDAPVVVMTTEVLRNMIYASSAALEGLHFVVLDEVHYLQDAYRGPVWEEVIVHLPPEVRLVCLSATVSNARELSEWISTVRGPTATVVEKSRPVKLDNFYVAHDRLKDELVTVPLLSRGRPNPAGRRFDPEPRERWSRRRRFAAPRRAEIVELLAERSMLPAIYFIFSRAACDDAVKACLDAGIRLTDEEERARIRAIVEQHVEALGDDDLAVLGHARWLTGLEAGIASHHAGMVPPFKEAVEACFVEGLVKAVFATETLALGINMPARTVVIEKLTKFTGERHEFLTPGQYTQLTGRAGRRGIDDHGNAMVLWSPFVSFDQVAELAASRSFRLGSAFRPTYNMAANLVRRYTREEAHHMLGLSFAQFQADRVAARRSGRSGRSGRRTDSIARTFDRVCELLEGWGHLEGWSLTGRGERLVRLYHESDLLVAESLEQGLFDELDPASLAGLVSCFTYEHRAPGSPPDPWFPSAKVRRRYGEIEHLAHEINADEARLGLPLTRAPEPGFAAMAHAWAAGERLDEVLEDEELSGGDFVRNVKQLLDLLRQIADAASAPPTAAAARQACEALFRGVVEASAVVRGDGNAGEGVDDDLVEVGP